MRTKTQFSEYAALLWKHVNQTYDKCQVDMKQGVLYSKKDIFNAIEETIAQDSRIFAAHVLSQIPALIKTQSLEEAVRAIPDMTYWPQDDIAEEDISQKETVMVPTPAEEAG